MKITLPKDWKVYENNIRDRCKHLIEHRIWNGIDIHRLNTWKQNFKSEEERYLAACLLDSLIYRPNEQTFSMIQNLLTQNLNNAFRFYKELESIRLPDDLMGRYKDPSIRLVSAIKKNDPVTKSSNEILRFMKRHFMISEKWIINPWNIKEEFSKGVKAVVFIDDFLGTGDQFDEIIKDSELEEAINTNHVFYAPLVAHQKGIDKLKTEYPKLRLIYTERLTLKFHSFFENYFPEEASFAKVAYLSMFASRGWLFDSGAQFGYGDLEITYAFQHAAPDNSLQAFTFRERNWIPLFDR